ncbi:MAG TPA: tetratricopeptide repeat-containing glycosyltransferase family protein [Bryobacteraceae bacterium]|jgi:hypothetical protein|nr:tetratricopeptide repeat-containing glycosyltransferase family protein [Bryobacteraceae bacterium]
MPEWGFMTVAMAREQVADLEQAMLVAPRPDICAQLAGCYSMLDRRDQALTLYAAAWKLLKTAPIAISYATALRELGRFEEAGRLTEYAYWTEPENAYIRLMHGETLLRAGLWKEAWALYDTGRPTKMGEKLRLSLPARCRQWNGQQLGFDEFLLVLMEGGAGDRINYARWLAVLSERAPNWKVFCYPPQLELFRRWLGTGRVVQDGDTISEWNEAEGVWWTTVFALPANFCAGPQEVPQWGNENFRMKFGRRQITKTPEDTRADWNGQPQLTASNEMVKKYNFLLNDDLPIVGICWEAAELSPVGDPEGRKVRSLTEAQAMRLVCMTGDRVHWVGVQHRKKLGFPVTSVPFDTWEETAGLLENLDALLTVDTGTMHLAGALRRPLGILLGSNSDWKFLAKGACPFYRSAKLYRNGLGGGFDRAVDLAIAAIRRDRLEAFG